MSATNAVITVRIEDNGVGISPDKLDSVLNGTAETTTPDGHGLGMSFVASECDENGFELSATSSVDIGAASSVDIGAAFLVSIPRS